METTEHSSNF